MATAMRRGALRLPAALAATVFLLALAAFWPALRCGFLHYDDTAYVTENRHVRDGLSAAGLSWALTTDHAANWHPLTWLSHMTDAELFGLDPRGHHLTSLLLHAGNALLLFAVLGAMTGAPRRSAAVAAIFAVHPLGAESVAWVSERKNVLSTLLLLLTLAAYLRYTRAPGLRRYLPVPLCLALGLAAKPMLVTVPFALLLLDYWPLGRLRLAPAPGPTARARPAPPGLRALLLEKLPLLALVALSSFVTLRVQAAGGAVRTTEAYPLAARVAGAFTAYVGYLGNLLLPTELAAFYPHPMSALSAPKVWLAALAVAAATAAAAALRSRLPHLAVGWFWYLGTLVPVIGLVQVGSQGMADRYAYVPMIGVLTAAVWTLARGARSWRWGTAAVSVCAALAVAALLPRARAQVATWRDDRALFTHALGVTRGNWFAHNLLGSALAREGRPDEAERHFREALELRPGYAEAHINLGLSLFNRGRLGEAEEHLRRALRAKADFSEAHLDLGAVLAAQGRTAEAEAEYRAALRADPESYRALNNLGTLAAGRRDFAGARRLFLEALALRPDYGEALFNMGVVLRLEGRPREALPWFSRVLAASPGDARALEQIEQLRAQSGGGAGRP